MQKRKTHIFAVTMILTILLALTPSRSAQASSCEYFTNDERLIASLMWNTSAQGRPYLSCDPILTQVARARAYDMASRGYFGHVNPDGIGPNYLVEQAGYRLPDWWGDHPSANYIESIAAGYRTTQEAWDAWMVSPRHLEHVLAYTPFFREQVMYGIGVVEVPGSQYERYYVVLTAPAQP